MEFDFQWLLWALPLAFALGWLASRFDLRQWRREESETPRAYFKGLNLLLNEQQDKAIDAFIEAVQQDPGSSDLHFALGNLFRRRGEYERAVRVHEHLLQRADLPRAERERAQHALAQDFMRAGLFDRAEQAYRALEATLFDTEARLALLGLYERSRDWHAAIETAGKLERAGTGSFATRIAHYWCEEAQAADARQQPDDAATALLHAREAAPQAARPLVLAGQRLARRGDHAAALREWTELRTRNPAAFALVAVEFARSALACGQTAGALESLQAQYAQHPGMDLLNAMLLLDPQPQAQSRRLLAHLENEPTPSAALAWLRANTDLDPGVRERVAQAVDRAARPLLRYRCAACGFEAQHYFWQCPGCLGWDTYPPQRLEEL
ncbi:MAG TPA: lipopolysaccharide assembly protein LapB [Burkholderiaceae bacterium]|nr:lipopolysaccharide assembly protein LapB [Burkholderiaceae bacterium]